MLFNRSLALGWAIALALPLVAAARTDEGDRSKIIDAFVAHIDQMTSVDESAKGSAKAAVEKQRQSADTQEDAITEGLIALYAGYRESLAAADGDIREAASQLRPWIESTDPFVATDASFGLARALVNAERFEDAIPLLESVVRQKAEYSLHAGAATYFLGVAQARLLQNQDAMDTLSQFLQTYPDAPERLRVSAWRQIQELAAIEEGQLADAHQRMDFSRRKLDQEDSGDRTQEQQDKIVRILAKLISEQEKKECSSCNSKKNCEGQNQNQAKNSGKKQSEPQANKSKQGGSSNNPNGVAERVYSDGPASPWSKLRDRSRDPAYSAIKDQLPAKYREIVERYTEKAQGGEPSDGGSQ